MKTFNDLINNQNTIPVNMPRFTPQTVKDLRQVDPIVNSYNISFSNLTETIMTKEGNYYYIYGSLVSTLDWQMFTTAYRWRNVPYKDSFEDWCNINNLSWDFDNKNGQICVRLYKIKNPGLDSCDQIVPEPVQK